MPLANYPSQRCGGCLYWHDTLNQLVKQRLVQPGEWPAPAKMASPLVVSRCSIGQCGESTPPSLATPALTL